MTIIYTYTNIAAYTVIPHHNDVVYCMYYPYCPPHYHANYVYDLAEDWSVED